MGEMEKNKDQSSEVCSVTCDEKSGRNRLRRILTVKV